MKKLSAIYLLLSLFFGQIGYLIYYIIEVQEVKISVQKEILSGLPETAFIPVCFEDNESVIKWDEEGKEFSLNGEMYDVAITKMENGKTIFYCLPDKKEEQLLSNYSKTVEASSEQNPAGKNQRIIKFHLPDLFVSAMNQKTDDKNSFISSEYFNVTPGIISSIKKIITPPPELAYKPKLNYV